MRTARSLLIAFGLFCALSFAVATSAIVQAPARTPSCTAAMQRSIANCPLTGCGTRGDPFLNQAKNRTGDVRSPERITLSQMRRLPEPNDFVMGSQRTDFAETESRGVVTMGFLLFAKRQGGESVNCGITGPENTDIHLVLIDEMPEDLDDQDAVDDAEEKSVTAEITPRVRRDGHPNWVVKHINDFEGEFVRITGRLMLDTEHLPRHRRLRRATNWEIHPVTRFEFCNSTVAQCRRGRGWQDF